MHALLTYLSFELAWTVVLTLVVAIVCHLKPLRERPAVCHVLWLLVLLKMIAPPFVPLPVLAANPGARSELAESTIRQPPRISSGRRGHGAPAFDPATPPLTAPENVISRSAGPPIAAMPRATASWMSNIDYFWAFRFVSLLGSTVIILVAARRFFGFRRLLLGACYDCQRAITLTAELAAEFGIRRPPAVAILEGLISPMLWAAPGGATIVLPRQAVDSLDDNQLRSIIAHELAHLARRDQWTQLFAFAASTLCWWNGSVWIARWQMREAAEACCDALAIERIPSLRKLYARSLLAMVDFLTLAQPLQSPFAIQFGASRSLLSRISLVANKNVKPRISRVAWGVLALALLAVVSYPTHAQQTPAPPKTAEGTPAVDKAGNTSTPRRSGEPLKMPEDVKSNEIAGVVVDSDGNPLAGVVVDVWSWYTGNEMKTDKDGVFRLKPANDPQSVEVRYSKPGYSPQYVVRQPTGVPAYVITLGNRTYIEGTVRGPDGAPATVVEVTGVQGEKHADGVVINDVPTTTTTDAEGHYRLYVFPDTYEIRVTAPGVGVARIPKIDVGSDEAKKLDIDLKPGVRFEARVVDANSHEPVQGVVLWHWEHPGVLGISDSEGKITIEGMLPGQFEFNIGQGKPKKMGKLNYYEHGDLGRWWSADAVHDHQKKTMDEGTWQRNFDALTFELSVGMKPVTFEVEQGVTFSGHVYDPDGKPVSGATVAPAKTGSANSLTGDTRYSTKTRKDGSFRVVMPAGNAFKYNLVVHDGTYGHWRHWANGVTDPLETRPGQKFENFDLKLTRGATVRGKIIAEGDRVVSGREVRAQAADRLENRYYDPTVKVRKDGTFELKFIRPGQHVVQVSWLAGVSADSAVTLDLKEGEVREGIELRVPPSAEPVAPALGSRTFRVKVVDAEGKPVPFQGIIATRPNVQQAGGYLTERRDQSLAGLETLKTGPDGVAEFMGNQVFGSPSIEGFGEMEPTVLNLLAIDQAHENGAIGVLYADSKNTELTLQMAPLVTVTASASIEKLPPGSLPAHFAMMHGSQYLAATTPKEGKLEMRLPPGDYQLFALNVNAKPKSVDFTVKPREAHKAIEPIVLERTRLASLIGQEAPELVEITEWQNGPAVTLAELRGKVVILDFWGYWCGPCLEAMPKLMALHDAYPNGELVILTIHDGSLQKLADLPDKIAEAKKTYWNNRDLPFRIGLSGGGPTQIDGIDLKANGRAVAEYGIYSFPTTLLIDKSGKVIEQLNVGDIDAAKKKIDGLLGK